MSHLLRYVWSGAACLMLSAALATTALAQKPDKDTKDTKDAKDSADKRPSIKLKAAPIIAMAPARIVLTAEITGGPNDYEEYYCPTVEWEWGDGTHSEATSDCAPYESGKSEIKRRYTVEHVFRAGNYRVQFRLKRRDKGMGGASISIQVRPGLRDGEIPEP